MEHQLKPGKRLGVTAVLVLLTYCFLLLLSRGFVTSGDDWFFTSRTMDENLFQALERGIDSARGHYRSVNGRLLGNGFSAFFGSFEFWREISRCGIILAVLLLICRMARVNTLMAYALTLTLVVALPSDLYAQSYAWAAGFFNYVPPIAAIFLYILRTDRLLGDGRDSALWGLGMGLAAFGAQLFVENVSAGMCLLSGIVLVWYLVKEKKLSWSLGGWFLGAVGGFVLMMSAPGYRNINQEGYRQVSNTLGQLMGVIRDNFFLITTYLTERNWVIIGGLTVVCLLLLMRVKQRKGLRNAAVMCLMVCPVYFYANYNILARVRHIRWISWLSFALDAAANLLYLLAVLTAVLLAVEDPARKRRGVLCILAVPMIFGPLLVVTPIGPRCLYIPYMLLVCLLVMLGMELAGKLPGEAVKHLRVPTILMCGCVLTVYLWVGLLNGHCEQVRTDMIDEAMDSGSKSVLLPSYPYTDYVHNGNGEAIEYYFYYEKPADLTFEFIPHNQWSNGS